jgi:hypothetical protein
VSIFELTVVLSLVALVRERRTTRRVGTARQSDPSASCPASSTTKTIPPTAWATPLSFSACGRVPAQPRCRETPHPATLGRWGTAATRRYQLRIAARAHELVAAGPLLAAACRIIMLEDQLAEARRLNTELQQRDI